MRTAQLNVKLPAEMAELVRSKVESGEYATESDVVRDGLRALQARDRMVELWLQQKVVPAFDAIKANPKRGRSPAQVRATIARVHKKATRGR